MEVVRLYYDKLIHIKDSSIIQIL